MPTHDISYAEEELNSPHVINLWMDETHTAW